MRMVPCRECVFFEPSIPVGVLGECRRHAPVVVFGMHDGQMVDETEFPIVNKANGCGDGERKGSVSADVERLVEVVHGCLDYGGGYRGDEGELDAFHHGIQTVINAVDRTMLDPDDTQSTALANMGRAAMRAKP